MCSNCLTDIEMSWQILSSWILHVWQGEQQNWCVCFWCCPSGAHLWQETALHWLSKRAGEPSDVGKWHFVSTNYHYLSVHVWFLLEVMVIFLWLEQIINCCFFCAGKFHHTRRKAHTTCRSKLAHWRPYRWSWEDDPCCIPLHQTSTSEPSWNWCCKYPPFLMLVLRKCSCCL